MNVHETRRKLIELDSIQTRAFDCKRGARIKCLRGKLWVTQEGDVRDHVLLPGVQWVTLDTGRIVVNGMGESNRFEFECCCRESRCTQLQHEIEYKVQLIDAVRIDTRRERAAMMALCLRAAWRKVRIAIQRAFKPCSNGLSKCP